MNAQNTEGALFVTMPNLYFVGLGIGYGVANQLFETH